MLPFLKSPPRGIIRRTYRPMPDQKTVADAKTLEELLEAHTLDLPHIRKVVRRIRIRASRAGHRQCLDNLMSNVAIAEAALAGTR